MRSPTPNTRPDPGDALLRLEKEAGETVLQDADLLSQYGWKWPSR